MPNGYKGTKMAVEKSLAPSKWSGEASTFTHHAMNKRAEADGTWMTLSHRRNLWSARRAFLWWNRMAFYRRSLPQRDCFSDMPFIAISYPRHYNIALNIYARNDAPLQSATIPLYATKVIRVLLISICDGQKQSIIRPKHSCEMLYFSRACRAASKQMIWDDCKHIESLSYFIKWPASHFIFLNGGLYRASISIKFAAWRLQWNIHYFVTTAISNDGEDVIMSTFTMLHAIDVDAMSSILPILLISRNILWKYFIKSWNWYGVCTRSWRRFTTRWAMSLREPIIDAADSDENESQYVGYFMIMLHAAAEMIICMSAASCFLISLPSTAARWSELYFCRVWWADSIYLCWWWHDFDTVFQQKAHFAHHVSILSWYILIKRCAALFCRRSSTMSIFAGLASISPAVRFRLITAFIILFVVTQVTIIAT